MSAQSRVFPEPLKQGKISRPIANYPWRRHRLRLQ
jgi:hypothetical protein